MVVNKGPLSLCAFAYRKVLTIRINLSGFFDMTSTFRRFAAFSFVAFTLTNLAPANAELVLEFGRNGVPGIQNFSMVPGSSLELDLFLTQKPDFIQTDFGSGFVDDNRLTEQGLSLAEFTFTIDRSGLAHGSLGAVQTGDGLLIFPDRTLRVSNQLLVLSLETPIDPNNEFAFVPVFPASGEDSIRLATATVALAPTATGSFQIEMAEPDDQEIYFNIGSGFSGFVPVTSAFATVTAVPEPSGLLGIAVASGLAVGLRRYRTRG